MVLPQSKKSACPLPLTMGQLRAGAEVQQHEPCDDQPEVFLMGYCVYVRKKGYLLDNLMMPAAVMHALLVVHDGTVRTDPVSYLQHCRCSMWQWARVRGH